MTKLESIEHKIFASEAPLDEIGQFGSALDTTKLNTKDVNTIQALPAYTKGWGSAVVSDSNYPTMEEMNGVLNVMSYHTGYLYQEGMPAWRSDREYSATSIVKEPTGTKFFRSLKDGNIGNTLDNAEYWEELKFGGSGLELCDTDIVIRDDEKMFTQLQQMRHSTFDKSKFTVVGSPTITDDGVASGFSNNNYLKTIKLSQLQNKSWSINVKWINQGVASFNTFFNFGSWISWGCIVFDSSINTISFRARTGTSTDVNNEGVWCTKQLGYTPDYIVATMSFDINTGTYTAKADWGKGEQVLGTYTPTTENKQLYLINEAPDNPINIGSGSDDTYNKDAIDLKQFSITVDGKEVFNGNKTGLDVIKPDNYEVVGSPVISADGVASGFSASDYINGLTGFILGNNFEIQASYTIDNNFSINEQNQLFRMQSGSTFMTTFVHLVGKSVLSATIQNSSRAITISPSLNTGKIYTSKIVVTSSNITSFCKVDNGGWTQIDTLDGVYNLSSVIDYLKIGYGDVTYWNGSIDLNSFKIYVDGNLVYQPCLKIPYTQSKTGSKIVDGVYRDRVIDLYEQQGQAGYYTIDETNKNFTLPMGEIYGMIESKGTYQPPLLSTMWSDHLLNDMSWLRADTFSWQDGTTYEQAYNELLAEYNNSASVEETEGSITFKRTPKGYKIALATQETAIAEKYTTDGIAWYYILDTANKKFKLPRAKHPSLVTLTNSVPVYGNGMTLGITNGTTNYGLAPSSNTENNWAYRDNAYGTTLPRNHGRSGNTPGDGQALGITTDPSKSGIVADLSSNVKDYNMYLYFYVGAFTKSAETQTAGLNAELLNSKVDMLQASGAAMPSNKYIDLTLGASGSTYTAPANGWFTCYKWGLTAAGYLYMRNNANGLIMETRSTINGTAVSAYVPVQKGQSILVNYDTVGTTIFRFIYAEGSK